MRIGIFDSGVGGASFARRVAQAFPDAEIVCKDDRVHLPYGNKTRKQLLRFTVPIFQQFEKEGCVAVLVACNTLTTIALPELRTMVSIPLVGVEPMIKPAAAMTKTGVIAVCATSGTLQSDRYAQLKDIYAEGLTVVEPDCSEWASMIEESRQNELELEYMVDDLRQSNVDVVVLGCTHYHWIEEELVEYAQPDIQVIQSIGPVLDQLERVIGEGHR